MKRDVMIEYLKEHYAAARHQQTLRAQATAFVIAISGVVFSAAIQQISKPEAAAWLGVAMVLLGLINSILISEFSYANRLHVEVVKWTRRILAAPDKQFSDIDPNFIRECVGRFSVPARDRERQQIIDALNKHFQGFGEFMRRNDEMENELEQIGRNTGGTLEAFQRQVWMNIPGIIVFTGLILILVSLM